MIHNFSIQTVKSTCVSGFHHGCALMPPLLEQCLLARALVVLSFVYCLYPSSFFLSFFFSQSFILASLTFSVALALFNILSDFLDSQMPNCCI